MTRRQRSRTIAIAAAIGVVLTILNIWRTHGLTEAAYALAWFLGTMAAFLLILAWESRGKP